MIDKNDFVRAKEIAQHFKLTINQVCTSLNQLRIFKAVNSIDQDGLWWYATPETDTRTREVIERVPESKPRVKKKK